MAAEKWGAFVALFLATFGGAPAEAQTWPQRPVKIIMPLPAGSGADAGLRVYVERLQQMWGQPVVVENRPGAEGIIAVSSFVKARDDHTLLYSYGGPITISPIVTKDLPYDPAKDLTPITAAADNVLGIAATTVPPIADMKGFEAFARANPGKVNWAATPGMPQFVFASFGKTRGLDMVYVPYKDVGSALQDLSTGRIHAYVTGLGTFRPLLQGGKAKLLALLNRERFPGVDAPTVAEAGYPEITGDGFNGFFGGADLKPEARDRIAADVATIAREPATRERLAALSQAPNAGGPEAFARMIAAQSRQITEIVRVLGTVPGQ